MLTYSRYPYQYYNYKNNNINKNNIKNNNKNYNNYNNNIKKEEKNRITKTSNTITKLGLLNFNPNGLTNYEKPIFEIFGIFLYIDDIIILCVLFFLYKEGIKDDMLYISLLILLIS